MATTQKQIKDGEDEFQKAFGEEVAKAPEKTEDEAFGIAPEAAAPDKQAIADPMKKDDGAAAASAGTTPAATVAAEASAAKPDAPAAAAATTAPAVDSDEPTDEKDKQRAKSWEGRLKARESDLAAREAALKEAEEKLKSQTPEKAAETIENVAETTDDPALAKAADKMADKVEAGKISPEAALKSLSEDFGQDFVDAITAAVDARVESMIGERMGKADKRFDELDGNYKAIRDHMVNSHYETISERHPDFDSLINDDGFKAWAGQYENGDAILQNGSARSLIKMFDDYKREHAPESPAARPHGQPAGEAVTDKDPEPASEVKDKLTDDEAAASNPEQKGNTKHAGFEDDDIDEAELDAATGVRGGGGLKLPDKAKKGAESFEDAFAEAIEADAPQQK